ncbi:MAG TPA: DUF3419 family protein [Geminicoccaceae bacterium]|nr:DUF3419 family protein [Geminicoccus sp.]HMU48586.1 DUF3419 family protein [Geminicoccaceae bacterium]
MARSLIHEAAASAAALSPRGLLERLFAKAFEGLVYPQIWEDPLVDMVALGIGPTTRIATIASGGCNVMSYLTAGPAEVLAVDLNPHHLALLRLKLAAAGALPGPDSFFRFFGRADEPGNVALYDRWLAPVLDRAARDYWEGRVGGRRRIEGFARGFHRRGLLGRTIGAAHLLAKLHGRDPARMLEAWTVAEQRRAFDEILAPLFDSPVVRALFRLPVAYFGLGIPPAQLEAMRVGGGDLAALVRERVRRLACDFPLGENYFAWQAFGRRYQPGGSLPPYLEGRHFAAVRTHARCVTPRLAPMTRALAERPAGSLDAFVLLDAQDWMTDGQLAALWAQIDRTAAPGARVIFRTAAARLPLEDAVGDLLAGWRYEAERSRELHGRDRSAIYGGFHLYQRAA